MNMGYHDDSFAFNTLFKESWYFMPKIKDAGLTEIWKTEPFRGEMRPEIQSTIWDDPPAKDAEDYNQCIETTHASWLVSHKIFTDPPFTGAKYDRALSGARKLGYELYVSAVKLPFLTDKGIEVNLKMQNKGVAPFYYDWTVQLAAVNRQGGGSTFVFFTIAQGSVTARDAG